MSQALRSVIEWGTAGRALDDPAEGPESGDLHVVIDSAQGALVGVIDGLGHGSEAAAAARAAAAALESNADKPIPALIELCHERIRRTRGVVLTLAAFDARSSEMTWAGVGNVEAILIRADATARPHREALTTRGGVVGYQLPSLRSATLRVSPGDTLVMATDGIRSAFSDEVNLRGDPQQIAGFLLTQYARGYDDALVLVARYLGPADA